jgi:ketosteroid isomerase-like protein
MSQNVADIVRRCYAAYPAHDRKAVEELIAEDFTFTSPRDDHIGRAAYFERCWPNNEKFRAINIEKLFVEGNEAFVRYEGVMLDGATFRCVEFFRVEGGKIRAVEVYFGTG